MDPWYLTALGNAYRLFAGRDATPVAIPLAVLRGIYGDDYTVRVAAKPFTINLRDTVISFHLLVYGVWERFESMLLERLIVPGTHVIDVGANIGYYTILFSEAAGPTGRVLAVEPDESILMKNVIDRGLSANVQVIQAAAGETFGKATLQGSRSGNQGNIRTALTSPGASDSATHAPKQVDVLPVDSLAAAWPRVDLIKVDIEGFELHAMRGMNQTLASNPDLIVVSEFSPDPMKAVGSDPLAYLRFLRSHGHLIWEIQTNRHALVAVDETGDQDLIKRLEQTREGYTNIICAHRPDRLQPIADFIAT